MIWKCAKRRLALRAALVALAPLALACCCSTAAYGAGMLVADRGFGGQLQIKSHDVRVTINNGVAVTEVEQVFENTENRVVEALYTFPVPKQASISNFSMWIGGKEMIGEVVEKEKARQIYESYKKVRRDPGLLEQVDYKRFEMRIFPIAARGEQRVRVTYYQELDFDHDRANYTYPLATVTQAKADQKTSGRFSFALDVKSEVPIVELKSLSHADQFVVVKNANPNYWQASLETQAADLTRDLVLDYQLERPRTGIDLITSKTGGEDGYYQLTMTAGKELEGKLKGSDYVFVIDISGSMVHDGKLGLSRDLVNAFVQSLDEEDRFELITFNIASTPLFSTMTSVNAENKQRAAEFLRSQKPLGGTVLHPAIEAAYRYYNADRQLNVVVLSDGMTEQREQRELLQLIKQRPTGSSVFCIGVGNEVNRPLLSQLATETGGLAAFMSSGDNFEQQAGAFRRKLTHPAATNVQLSFEGAEVYDLEPQQLPNLYFGQPVRLYGRYKKNGPAKVQLKADLLGSPTQQAVAINLPAEDQDNPEIERMWALHRVERLMGDGRREGTPGAVDEIVRLCEGYSIASEFASFIVLENDAEYQRWKIDRRNATRIGRDRQAQLAVHDRLEELRRQTAQQVGPQAADSLKQQAKRTGRSRTETTPTQVASVDPNQQPAVETPPAAQTPSTSQAPTTDNTPPVDAFAPQVTSGRHARSGRGGGAIDPLTGLIAAGLAGLGWASRRKQGRRGAHRSC